ncbi:hypothetical protein F4810DRAFT_185358 [Camillea tinctor]|nr:hypothetical protein F4810DRAFT_185358 [Camillea tinctor]
MRIFKNPIFTTDAWLWVLFERSRLQQAVMDFRQCNLELGDFVPILLWSTALTRQDLGNIVRNISEESSPASQNAQSFLPHIRIREVAEYSNSTVHDSDTLEFSPLPDARQVFASISSTGMVTEAIPKARVEFKYYRPCGDYGQNLEDDPIGKSTSEIGGELQSKDPLIAQAHQLARLLFEAGSHEFHTLPFRGYLNDPSSSRFAFYFDYPQDVSDHEPTTLHRLIEDGNGASRLYLPQRFKIALTISRALGAFHADGWVHKSVRSHSVIFFYNNENQSMYDKPYLVDFEFSRPDAGATLLAFDDDLERNLYRHPDRQELPIIGFNKMHDVYALGIVLLELGLWQTARSIYDTARKEGREASVRNATRMQGTYLACARKDIGHIMGPDYLEAVITCLSGELSEFLNKKDFAFMFWKKVVEKVDPRRLLNSASE